MDTEEQKPTEPKPRGRSWRERKAPSWAKGQSGNPYGRPKLGPKDREIRRLFEALTIDGGKDLPDADPDGKPIVYSLRQLLNAMPYLENLLDRIKMGKANHIEMFLWEHYYGKPKVTVELKEPPKTPLAALIKEMTPEELAMFAAMSRRMLAAQNEPKA